MSRNAGAGFDRLVEYIEEEMEFATSHYNDAYLDRRIGARMRRTGHDEYGAYRRLLAEDDGEREALLDALSINVTGFFRNPEVWERLRAVLRGLSDRRRRVRVWSAPCADGREPYSLAMLALDDDGVDAGRVEVTATDIDREALATAREGVYHTTRTTRIEEELRPLDGVDRYVEREDDRFRVREAVRDLVTFERHDLIRGEARGPFDLVCCRNLFIYIDREYKEPVTETVTESLRPGGYLALGKTETLPRTHEDAYDPVAKPLRIYRRAGGDRD
ncbi:MAG: protein-glutamate O-methyltransferase CheR [Haloferacaceae archaeon]